MKHTPENDIPMMQVDGHGRLLVNGHVLKFCNKAMFIDDEEKEGFSFQLGYALRTAQLEGHIPQHCEYVLNDGGGMEMINRDLTNHQEQATCDQH